MKVVCFILAVNKNTEGTDIWLEFIKNSTTISRLISLVMSLMSESEITILTDSSNLVDFINNNYSKIHCFNLGNNIDYQSYIYSISNPLDTDAVILINPIYPFISFNSIATSISKLSETVDVVYGIDYHYISNAVINHLSILSNIGIGFTTIKKTSLFEVMKGIVQNEYFIKMNQLESVKLLNKEDVKFINCIAGWFAVKIKRDFLEAKISNVKLLVLDVDGVLTDGGMYYAESGDEFKKFNTKDGMAIKRLIDKGVCVGFLSSGINSKLIENRAKLLGVKYCYVGFERKKDVLRKWMAELGLEYKNIAYVGDDINDIDNMRVCGLTACPNDAVGEIQEIADITLMHKGGNACIREFIDKYLM